MRKIALSVLLIFFLLASGCSYVPVHTSSLTDRKGARFIDPEDSPISVEEIAISDTETGFSVNYSGFTIELEKPCHVKYYKAFGFIDHQNIWVTGQLPNGNKYPIMIDSGFDRYLYTNDLVVLENDLAIHPGEKLDLSTSYGLCHLPELHIGEMKLANPPCEYGTRHWELQLLGLPFSTDDLLALLCCLLQVVQLSMHTSNICT